MFKLLKYFSLTSAVVIGLITAIVTGFSYLHELDQVVDFGERQNIAVARVLSNSMRSLIPAVLRIPEGGDAASLRSRPETVEFDAAVRNIAAGLPVLKIKLYDTSGLTVYSSEAAQIGESKAGNPGFQKAAAERTPASALSFRDSFSAFDRELFERDVVETYIPVSFDGGDPIGVFEVYADVTPMLHRSRIDVVYLLLGLTALFALLYLALFVIVRRADGILARQYRDLEREIDQRHDAEAGLRHAHDQLETRVEERTAQLNAAVHELTQEIAERRQAEEALRKLTLAVEQSPASVVISDPRGIIEYVNPKFVDVTGYAPSEVIGRHTRLLKSGHMPVETYADLWTTITEDREWRGEFQNRKKNGELFWEYASISPIKDPVGRTTHFVAVKEDVTLRKEYEERLVHQANFDLLTGLANRLLAVDRLSQAVARARRGRSVVAVLMIDLDHLKKINDSLGHAVGDEVLIEMAHRLVGCLRASDSVARPTTAEDDETGGTVARLGGDEFVAILPDLQDSLHAEVVAEKIIDASSRPFRFGDHEVFLSASVGISIFPNDGEDNGVLMRNADAALHKAKEDGRGTVRFFTAGMNESAVVRLRLEGELRRAQERGDLRVHYQPLVDGATARLIGAEALLRWESSTLGAVSPTQIIPLAEETGLIVPIGEWVLRTACAEAARWTAELGEDVFVSVNVSSRQFQQSDLGSVEIHLELMMAVPA